MPNRKQSHANGAGVALTCSCHSSALTSPNVAGSISDAAGSVKHVSYGLPRRVLEPAVIGVVPAHMGGHHVGHGSEIAPPGFVPHDDKAAAPSPRAAGRTRGRRADAAPARSSARRADSGAAFGASSTPRTATKESASQEAPTSHAAEPDQPRESVSAACTSCIAVASLSANARTVVTSMTARSRMAGYRLRAPPAVGSVPSGVQTVSRRMSDRDSPCGAG